MTHHVPRPALIEGEEAAVPHERAEDDRILEALALVDRDDLDDVLVALQPELLLVRFGPDVGGARHHPLHETVQSAGMPGRLVLQQLAQVQQVGEATFAVVVLEETARQPVLGEQLAEHQAEPVRAPALVMAMERVDPARPRPVVVEQRRQRLAGHLEQLGAERRPQQRVAPRLGDGEQHAPELLRLPAGEHAVLRLLHARHPPAGERRRNQSAMLVRPHQHRDVAALQRSRAAIRLREAGLAGFRETQQARDLPRRGLRDPSRRRVLREHLGVVVTLEEPDAEGLGCDRRRR